MLQRALNLKIVSVGSEDNNDETAEVAESEDNGKSDDARNSGGASQLVPPIPAHRVAKSFADLDENPAHD